MFWRRKKNSGTLDPNNVPAILVPWLKVVEKYGPDEVEGRTSNRVFEWLKNDRAERDALDAIMSEWKDAEDDAYHEWSPDITESKEGWRFYCFFGILDTFEVRTGAYRSDPVERYIRMLQRATGDSDGAARTRSTSIHGLWLCGEFARPALPLVRELLKDESPLVRARAHVLIVEFDGHQDLHEEAIEEIIKAQPPPISNLTQIQRMRAENAQGEIAQSLEHIRMTQREKDMMFFRSALRNGFVPLVRQLLPRVDRREFEGELNDLLFSTAFEGHAECTRLLLDWGARANYFDENLGLPLIHIVAVKRRCADVLRVLIEYGANPAVLDSGGRTAADVAREFGHHEYLDILQKKGDP